MTTPPLDLPALKEIANAATPGPWEAYDSNEGMDRAYSPMWCVANEEFHNPTTGDDEDWMGVEIYVGDKADSDHIATFDPPTVLALLDRVEELEAEKRADALMLDSARTTPTGFDIQMHAGGPKTQETLVFIADSMRGALDEYDAKNYLEMTLRATDGKNYVMTLQRQGGAVTPHGARQEAEARAEAAEKKVAAAEELLRNHAFDASADYGRDEVEPVEVVDAGDLRIALDGGA